MKYHVPTGFGFSPKASGFVSVPQFLSTEPRVGRGINLFFTIITDPLRGSTPHHILITKLRSIALQFSLAWCFA
ncbi:MAG: hypothetical protein SPE23_06905 [Sodaliphilus sp.]|nr:hypothetical protein [Sodaliphilus sp.]